MAKRIQNNETTEQGNPFLEEGSLEPETDESSFDDEDPLTKKKKKKAAKKAGERKAGPQRAAPKKKAKAVAETDEDEGDELTQMDALADSDETPDEEVAEVVEKPVRKTKVVPEKRTVLVAESEETTTRREPPVATVVTPVVTEAPKLSTEDLLKTMTAAFDKTTTSLREIPVEIATSLEQARDEAEHRSSFVSKLTLGLSAAACVFSLLAVGLAQSTRHRELVATTAPATATTVTRAARAERPARIERTERVAERTEPKVETPTGLPQARTPRVARTEHRTETLAAARATRRTQTTATNTSAAKTQALNEATARTTKRTTRRVPKDF